MVLGQKNGIMVVHIILMVEDVCVKPVITVDVAKQLIRMRFVADME